MIGIIDIFVLIKIIKNTIIWRIGVLWSTVFSFGFTLNSHFQSHEKKIWYNFFWLKKNWYNLTNPIFFLIKQTQSLIWCLNNMTTIWHLNYSKMDSWFISSGQRSKAFLLTYYWLRNDNGVQLMSIWWW